MNLCVFVLESPSVADLYRDHCEGRYIADLVDRCQHQAEHRLVHGVAEFDQGLAEATNYLVDEDSRLVVHISCHGDQDGLEFLDGDTLEWAELADSLEQVFAGKTTQVGVVLSSCSSAGVHSWSEREDSVPWALVVGATVDIGWDEAMVALSVFYYRLMKANFDELQDAINAAVGENHWIVRATTAPSFAMPA